jgi:hypothetical protein
METKQSNARYSIGTITSKDINLLRRSEALRQNGETHESIYIAGLESLEKRLTSS